jgi:hypothetical protein
LPRHQMNAASHHVVLLERLARGHGWAVTSSVDKVSDEKNYC